MKVFVGGDASKGYADWCCVDESGRRLCEAKADDSWQGHDAVEQMLKSMMERGASKIFVGLESSGGVERNWLGRLRVLSLEDGLNLDVVHLNPLLVHKHRDTKLHYNVTDVSSARTIADLLRHMDLSRTSSGTHFDEAKRLEQYVAGLVTHKGQLQTQLQGVLVNSHPELVQYCRSGVPGWMLKLLDRFPTTADLANARPEEVMEIPHLKPRTAEEIMGASTRSVASATGPLTASLVKSLVGEIQRVSDQVRALDSQLQAFLGQDRTAEILRSVPGFGPKISCVLRLIYGDFTGFASEAAVVAYAGLDPRIHQSGDLEVRRSISRRGKSRVRALLYMAAIAAIRSEGPMRDFYQRLIGRGKPTRVALVAVMAKMLRVAYACVMKDQLFDPAHKPRVSPLSSEKAPTVVSTSLTAPVSRKEAQKRKKAAAATKSEVKPQERGQPLPAPV